MSRTRESVHFANLTRGLACCPERASWHFLRIQSTWCEQKRWADVLGTVGPDFLAHLALGSDIVVHDLSEKPRITRACWQGLVWVRFACERLWGAPAQPAIVRGNHNASEYFDRQLASLDDRLAKQIRYFRSLYEGRRLLSYRICLRNLEQSP